MPEQRVPIARLNLRAAMLVALAIFAQESVWAFYDAQVPASIAQYTTSAALIGLLMGVDNVLGIFVQPMLGHLSDRTRSRFGRRIPYLAIGAPIAAILFALIPHTTSFGGLIACIFLFALTANGYKAITESLTPDFQPPSKRSTANAIAKIASSATIIVSALISLLIVDHNLQLAFAIPAVMLLLAALVVTFTIHEERAPGYLAAAAESAAKTEPAWTLKRIFRELLSDSDRSRLFLLVAVFFVAGTWAAMRAQLTPYAMEVLDLSRGQAGALTLPAGIAFIVAALPVAALSNRFGRRRMTRVGLAVFIAGCFVALAIPTVTMTIAGVVIAAMGFSTFAINAVVIMWNLAPSPSVVGIYTGLYAVSYAIGSSLGPAMIGVFVDFTDWRFMFLAAAILAAVGLVCFSAVRTESTVPTHGDDTVARPSSESPTEGSMTL